jgi:hypothetical protein
VATLLSIGFEIHRHSRWLGATLNRAADDAFVEHEQGRFREAALHAAICLEGVLKIGATSMGIALKEPMTLGPAIGALRDSGRCPGELLQRLNTANEIRNRTPHDKDQLLRITEGDSPQLLCVLSLVVSWFGSQFGEANGTQESPDSIRIFLSLGGPHRLDQEQFVNNLRSEFRHLGVRLINLTKVDFDQKPFDQITDLMRQCRAALVVGLDRSHAYTVFERERSPGQRILHDQYIPTAWNQIEGAIAAALRLRVLVLREERLHHEGIFEAENHRHAIRNFSLRTESRAFSPELREDLARWVKLVRDEPPAAASLGADH